MIVANSVAIIALMVISFVPDSWKLMHDGMVSFLEGLTIGILILNLGMVITKKKAE